jgi:uncharacterized SAM-binding protein YcdF (DUF218 family)
VVDLKEIRNDRGVLMFRKFSIRNIMGIILILLGVYSIAYSFSIMAFGVTFSKFFLAVGVLFTILGIIVIFIDEKYLVHKPKFVVKLIKFMFILLLSSFIIVESFIVYHGSKSDTAKVDYLVVLGAGLWGETPSLTLKQRLDESLEFIKVNPNTKVVLSGGMGPGEAITEAEAMKRYLIEQGVDEKLLIKEDKSTSTKENLKFTREVLRQLDNRENLKIKIITTNFHMFRSKLLARSNGFEVYGQPAPIHPLLIPAYYIREYMAVIKSFVFDFI